MTADESCRLHRLACSLHNGPLCASGVRNQTVRTSQRSDGSKRFYDAVHPIREIEQIRLFTSGLKGHAAGYSAASDCFVDHGRGGYAHNLSAKSPLSNPQSE